MKIKYLFLIGMFLTTTFTILSCSKETDITDKQTCKTYPSKSTELILNFKQKLKQKSTTTLTNDSAIWFLEGLLNYENANNSHNLGDLEFFNDTLILSTSGSGVNIEDLNAAYTYFTQELNQISQQQNNPDFKFDLVNMEILPLNLKNGETKITMNASGGQNLVGVYLAFGATDYWRWGWDLGICEGGHIGTDAADLLELRFNNPAAGVNPLPGYFTAVETRVAWFWDTQWYDPNYTLGWMPYMLFYASGSGSNPSVEPCLTPADLNYYLSKFDYIKNAKKPVAKTFKNVDVVEDFPTSLTTWGRGHDYYLSYGIFNYSIPNQ